MGDFFAMGGYAAYVWPAYAAAALILAVLLAVSLHGLRRREATLKLLEETRPRRRAARHGNGPIAHGPVAHGPVAEGPAADRARSPAAEGGEG